MNRVFDAITGFAESAKIASELSRSTTPGIDERFMRIAEKATSIDDSFFTCIARAALDGYSRPEAIDHEKTLLQPNPYSTADVDSALGLIDLMLPQDTPGLIATFSAYAKEHDLFERINLVGKDVGEKFIVVSNHLELPDQGFTMGLWHKAAREQRIDRLEHNLTVVVGRLIGYYQLDKTNVVDGILRKAGSVLKTFPSGGTEAMSEDVKALSMFRQICNYRTKQSFKELLESRDGRIICMAPSGEQDKEDRVNNTVTMSRFGKGTTSLLAEASTEHGATIIPIFADYKQGLSTVSFLDPIPPGALKSREDCDLIGQAIAIAGNHIRGKKAAQFPGVPRYKQSVSYATG